MSDLQKFSTALAAALDTGITQNVPPAVIVNALELAKLQILQRQMATAQAQAMAELSRKIIPASVRSPG